MNKDKIKVIIITDSMHEIIKKLLHSSKVGVESQ